MKKTIGYLRVSTADQDVEKNKADILKLANDKRLGHVEFIDEKVSGIKDWRKRKLLFGDWYCCVTIFSHPLKISCEDCFDYL